MLLVFIVGVPIILATRWVFFVHDPAIFERTSPSISKTAAYAPASYLFTAGMVVTAVFLIISWYIARRVISWCIDSLQPGPGTALLRALGGAASALGIFAGILLALLAVVSLEYSNDGHMVLSALFYASQVTAFILDAAAAAWLGRRARRQGDGNLAMPGSSRIWVCLAVVISVCFFLLMFNLKDAEAYDDSMLVQRIYVASEYILAILCLGYAVAGYFDSKPYFRKLGAST